MTWQITTAQVEAWAVSYDGPKFHALLCDPPYHLTSITQRFGQADSAPAKGDVYHRAAKGFMGQTWDGGDVAFRPETWAALAAHLHPGAFGMAFASARNWHRLAVAIEDAGLVIHPSIFWCYGQGFPHATRLDTQIDRDAGVEREVIGQEEIAHDIRNGHGRAYAGEQTESYTRDVTAPATELAQAWAGHRYGLQALKPAVEPIIVFQKPYRGRPIDNITQTGAGALNIEGSKVGERWPANLVLTHHPACNGVCHPECPVTTLADEAQYFHQSDWSYEVAEQMTGVFPLRYCPKPGRPEREAGLDDEPLELRHRVNAGGMEHDPRWSPIEARNTHPTVKPIGLTRYLAGLLLPPEKHHLDRNLLVPFAGVGSEMVGALLAGWDEIEGVEAEAKYARKGERRLAWWARQSRWGQTEPGKLLKSDKVDSRQLSIFEELV